jgi:hypothetical protein
MHQLQQRCSTPYNSYNGGAPPAAPAVSALAAERLDYQRPAQDDQAHVDVADEDVAV